MSKQYRCASLVKIDLFLQETGCRQAIFQQSKPLCDLEKGVKVTQMSSAFCPLPMINLCKFGLNPSIPSGDRMQTRGYKTLSKTPTRMPTQTGSALKTICLPIPMVGGHNHEILELTYMWQPDKCMVSMLCHDHLLPGTGSSHHTVLCMPF